MSFIVNEKAFDIPPIDAFSVFQNIETKFAHNVDPMDAVTFLYDTQDKILQYCVNRLKVLHGVCDINNYTLDVSDTKFYVVSNLVARYEKNVAVVFTNMNALNNSVNALLKLETDIERIKFTLLTEYQYLPDYINNALS